MPGRSVWTLSLSRTPASKRLRTHATASSPFGIQTTFSLSSSGAPRSRSASGRMHARALHGGDKVDRNRVTPVAARVLGAATADARRVPGGIPLEAKEAVLNGTASPSTLCDARLTSQQCYRICGSGAVWPAAARDDERFSAHGHERLSRRHRRRASDVVRHAYAACRV